MIKNYDWEELDKLFLKEGENVEEFCQKYDIPKTTLRGHLRRMKEKETKEVPYKEEPSQIVPVTLLKTTTQHAGEKQASSSLIKLHINDVSIEVWEGFSKETLWETLEVVKALC